MAAFETYIEATSAVWEPAWEKWFDSIGPGTPGTAQNFQGHLCIHTFIASKPSLHSLKLGG